MYICMYIHFNLHNAQYNVRCMIASRSMCHLILHIYIDTYRLFCSEMAESHQRGREPTGVSSNKNIL